MKIVLALALAGVTALPVPKPTFLRGSREYLRPKFHPSTSRASKSHRSTILSVGLRGGAEASKCFAGGGTCSECCGGCKKMALSDIFGTVVPMPSEVNDQWKIKYYDFYSSPLTCLADSE